MRRRLPAAVLDPPRNILIVGGTGGIGRAIVDALAPDAERIAFTYRSNAVEAERLDLAVRDHDTAPVPIEVDLSDAEAWDRALKEIVEAEAPDLLVNAAGVTIDRLCIDAEPAAFWQQYAVNVYAPWRAMTMVGREMAYRRSGRIVNVASIAATHNSPGRSVYASTKAALVSLTRSFASELGRFGVRVNAVAPGFVDTEMIAGLDDDTRSDFVGEIPLGRFATVDDVAAVVKFLSTPAASYLHGAVIPVDGGTTA